MKKIKLLLSAAAVALVAMFTLAPAVQAQTVASLTADPVFVEAAGEQTFAMTGIRMARKRNRCAPSMRWLNQLRRSSRQWC